MAFYRLNFAAKPLGKDETEKTGPTNMSFTRKKELCTWTGFELALLSLLLLIPFQSPS